MQDLFDPFSLHFYQPGLSKVLIHQSSSEKGMVEVNKISTLNKSDL